MNFFNSSALLPLNGRCSVLKPENKKIGADPLDVREKRKNRSTRTHSNSEKWCHRAEG